LLKVALRTGVMTAVRDGMKTSCGIATTTKAAQSMFGSLDQPD
jgi:hypothetical protein